MRDVMGSDIWINGGYFILRREFLDELRPGEDLVEEPLQRLLPAGQVLAQRHEGFWAPMDTLKDQQWLEGLHEGGERPVAGMGPRPRRASRPRVRGLRLMLPLRLGPPEASAARVLAIGAHPDDIEIGCGGTLMKLIDQGAVSELRWVVLSGDGRTRRGGPKERRGLLEDLPRARSSSATFPTATSPTRASGIKDLFEELKAATVSPTSSSPTSARTCTRTTG